MRSLAGERNLVCMADPEASVPLSVGSSSSYEHGSEFVDIFDLQAEGMREVNRFLAACASVHLGAAFYMLLDIG